MCASFMPLEGALSPRGVPVPPLTDSPRPRASPPLLRIQTSVIPLEPCPLLCTLSPRVDQLSADPRPPRHTGARHLLRPTCPRPERPHSSRSHGLLLSPPLSSQARSTLTQHHVKPKSRPKMEVCVCSCPSPPT
uniref:Uncharacterized protein n=1 Tax=Knipowitschia caucasica TaxID=637954 RepID=A0AAV2L7A0_KNICA